MIRQAHRCTALSLLLAAGATLLLYQPDTPPPNQAVATEPESLPPPEPVIAEAVPELTPAMPWGEPAAAPSAPPAAPVVSEPARPNPLLPRKSFTMVAPGERLADVAQRVYGSPAAVERLWQANRDTLPNRDSPLPSGTLLRTP
jgi:hypothetical protein